jgi:hypothetical protein
MQFLTDSTGANKFTISRTLSPSSQSEPTTEFILEKYRQCHESHARCNAAYRSKSSTYPSRLLDIGNDEQSFIVLRGTRLFHDKEYACLSHCWGDVKPFVLNSSTHFALAQGIEVGMLPKTFQDATIVARSLCIQYVWIDSLYAVPIVFRITEAKSRRCILQDSNDDWASESSRMGDIYANAVCTIAATAARDSSDGLFFERCSQLHVPRRVTFGWPHRDGDDLRLAGPYLCDVTHLAQKYIEQAPLNQRAWVCQERQLSRRVLHFTSTQVFWECLECAACETYPGDLPPWARAFWSLDGTALKNRISDLTLQNKDELLESVVSTYSSGVLDAQPMFKWLIFRDQYSRCTLTRDSDKLVAISGIANWVGQATGDELVAGLWLGRIIEELCWRTEAPASKSMVWRAPTWSWAGFDAHIEHSLLTKFHLEHAGRLMHAELVYLEVTPKTSGELEHAFLRIKCRPIRSNFWPAASLASTDPSLHGILELMNGPNENERVEWISRLPHQAVEPDVSFHIDDLSEEITEPQLGYICVLQQCLHENIPEISQNNAWPKPDESGEPRADQGEESSSDDESDVGLPSEPWDHDYVEALFIRMRNGSEEEFERQGMVRFRRFHAVDQILRTHNVAEEREITLF